MLRNFKSLLLLPGRTFYLIFYINWGTTTDQIILASCLRVHFVVNIVYIKNLVSFLRSCQKENLFWINSVSQNHMQNSCDT